MASAIESPSNIIADFVATYSREITNDENNAQKMAIIRQGLVLLDLPNKPNFFIAVRPDVLCELTVRVGAAAFEAYFNRNR
jgi:hypothetical protein